MCSHTPHPNTITLTASAATPNFISDIFYLCNALGHYGYIRTIQVYEDLGKTLDDYQRHHDMVTGDGSWMGVRVFSLMITSTVYV